MEQVERDNIVIISAPSKQSGKKTVAIATIILIAVVSIGGYALYRSPGEKNHSNGTPSGDWWETYTAVHAGGAGNNDWWTAYPAQHPSSGGSVSHPQWVLDALQDKPVVILDHSIGCVPCQQQGEDMETVLEEHGLEVAHYDLVADGSDQRAYDCFDAYDPNDGQSYVPLTIMLTLMEDGNGDVQVVWHSVEGATGEDWINTYMEDAIHYYRQNIADWGG